MLSEGLMSYLKSGKWWHLQEKPLLETQTHSGDQMKDFFIALSIYKNLKTFQSPDLKKKKKAI